MTSRILPATAETHEEATRILAQRSALLEEVARLTRPGKRFVVFASETEFALVVEDLETGSKATTTTASKMALYVALRLNESGVTFARMCIGFLSQWDPSRTSPRKED